jgi:hypothetical protein
MTPDSIIRSALFPGRLAKENAMRSLATKLPLTLGLLAAVVPLGCLISKPGPTASPSAFFTGCSNNLTAIVQRSATGVDCTWGGQGTGSGSGSGPSGYHGTCDFHTDVTCSPEGMDKIMHALKADLVKTAQDNGARIDETVEGAGEQKSLKGFRFDYSLGNAHGFVEADVSSGEAGPQKPGAKKYKLTVKMEEWAR